MSSAMSVPQVLDARSEGSIKQVQPAVIAPMSGNVVMTHGKFQGLGATGTTTSVGASRVDVMSYLMRRTAPLVL